MRADKYYMRILEDFLDDMGKDALVKKNARDVVVDDANDNDERQLKDFDVRLSVTLIITDKETIYEYKEKLSDILDNYICVDDFIINVRSDDEDKEFLFGFNITTNSSLKSKVKLILAICKLFEKKSHGLWTVDENGDYFGGVLSIKDITESFKFNNTGLTSSVKHMMCNTAGWIEEVFHVDHNDIFDYIYAFICKKVKIRDEIYYKAHPFS